MRSDMRKKADNPIAYTMLHHDPDTDRLIRQYQADAWDEGRRAALNQVGWASTFRAIPNPYRGAATGDQT